ncbi:MAG: hypothetical protein JNG85_10745 [Spirochaetaceae bacterium]|nr:hypothetical protein [Spirochaetaceae bacterium]
MAFNNVASVADSIPVRRALVSVYDKTGLEELVRGLLREAPGIEFYSTGGTYEAIGAALSSLGPAAAAARLVAVSDYTGQPEMAGGLVKTLDWKIYLGLLAETGNASHAADLDRLGAKPFDLVVGNLYPFAEAAGDASSPVEALRQRIDIGGPAMIRAAAKNFLRVASVSDPGQYGGLLEELRIARGATRLEFRRRLAASAFDRISRFDRLVADRLAGIGPEALAAAYSTI